MDLKEHFKYLKTRADVAPCCRNGTKLTVEDQGNKVYKARCGICGRGHIMMVAEPWSLNLTHNDKKLAMRKHVAGDGGPPPGRKIILPKGV